VLRHLSDTNSSDVVLGLEEAPETTATAAEATATAAEATAAATEATAAAESGSPKSTAALSATASRSQEARTDLWCFKSVQTVRLAAANDDTRVGVHHVSLVQKTDNGRPSSLVQRWVFASIDDNRERFLGKSLSQFFHASLTEGPESRSVLVASISPFVTVDHESVLLGASRLCLLPPARVRAQRCGDRSLRNVGMSIDIERAVMCMASGDRGSQQHGVRPTIAVPSHLFSSR
jgi:hypothetical protein